MLLSPTLEGQSDHKKSLNCAPVHMTPIPSKKRPTAKYLAKLSNVSICTIQRIRRRDKELAKRLDDGYILRATRRGHPAYERLAGDGLRAVVAMASGTLVLRIETYRVVRGGPRINMLFANNKMVESGGSLRAIKSSARRLALAFREGITEKVRVRLVALMAEKRSKYIRLAADWLRDSQCAEDVLQDSLVQALCKSWQFDLTRDIEPWFTIVLRNQCFMRLRSLKRRAEWVGSEIMDEHEADEREEPSEVFESEALKGMFTFNRIDGSVADVTIAQLLSGIPAKHRKLALALWGEGQCKKVLINQYKLSPDQFAAITQQIRQTAVANLERLGCRPN